MYRIQPARTSIPNIRIINDLLPAESEKGNTSTHYLPHHVMNGTNSDSFLIGRINRDPRKANDKTVQDLVSRQCPAITVINLRAEEVRSFSSKHSTRLSSVGASSLLTTHGTYFPLASS